MRSVVSFLVLLAFVGICLGAGSLGSLVTVPAIGGWYAALAKPTWTPPGWLFGPVWTALYVAMGVSAWLVWRTGRSARSPDDVDASPSVARRSSVAAPLVLFAIQLGLNVAWSWVFFGMKSPGLAALEIVALWLAILATTIAFFRRSAPAGWLMIPYLAWVSFAAALNWTIWRMNAA